MKGELKEMKKYNDDVLNVPENFITDSMLWIFNFIIIYLYSNYFNQIFQEFVKNVARLIIKISIYPTKDECHDAVKARIL